MEKFYLKNGKEVQIGDTLTKVIKTKHPLFGEGTVIESIVVTNAAIPQLLKAGIISKSIGKVVKEAEEHEMGEKKLSISYYIEKLAERLGWKVEKVYNYLNTIDSVYPAAALSLILKEIAVELDKKYKDHIQNSPEIFAISMLNGRVGKINKANIKNYKNFAAFRSIEDAKIACSIVRDVLKEMFKDTSGK